MLDKPCKLMVLFASLTWEGASLCCFTMLNQNSSLYILDLVTYLPLYDHTVFVVRECYINF